MCACIYYFIYLLYFSLSKLNIIVFLRNKNIKLSVEILAMKREICSFGPEETDQPRETKEFFLIIEK